MDSVSCHAKISLPWKEGVPEGTILESCSYLKGLSSESKVKMKFNTYLNKIWLAPADRWLPYSDAKSPPSRRDLAKTDENAILAIFEFQHAGLGVTAPALPAQHGKMVPKSNALLVSNL